MTGISRELAARLPALHERQERLETENLIAGGLTGPLGVSTRTWPDGLWSVRTESAPDHEPGNQITGVTTSHLDVLPERVAWHAEAGCGVHLRWPGPAVSHAVSERLAAMGLLPSELEAWMASPLEAVRADAPRHDIFHSIGAVATEAELEAWLSVFLAGWDVTEPGLQRVARAAMGAWPGPPEWRRYLARVDGEPAAEALLTLFGDVAYLAEASTVPAHRRRGIQRALIAHRLESAREAGARAVFGAVRYGDASWSNMRAMGLREEFLTLRFKRPSPDTNFAPTR